MNAPPTEEASGSSGKRPASGALGLPPLGSGVLKPRSQRLVEQAMPVKPKAVVRALNEPLCAVLPSAGSSTASPIRTEAIASLSQIRDRFVTLLQCNWAPDEMDKAFDAAVMPILVAAQNARNPDLRLTFLDDPDKLKEWLAVESPADEVRRALFRLPGYTAHSVVAEVRRMDGRTSVLLVDSLEPDMKLLQKYEASVLPALRRRLPRRTTLAMLALGTQTSATGCRIFALSFASKLVSLKTELDRIHERNLPGVPFLTSSCFPAKQAAGTRQVRLFNGRALMPLAFMKHAQSSPILEDWQAEHPETHPDEPVNKKGQSLIRRHDAHLVDRYSEQAQATGPTRDSVSIEKKRVTLLNRAIEYIRQAPESECRDFLDRLSEWDIKEATIPELELERRQWGPSPAAIAAAKDAVRRRPQE